VYSFFASDADMVSLSFSLIGIFLSHLVKLSMNGTAVA